MMKSADIKRAAIQKLAGNWNKAFCICTIFTIVNIALTYLVTLAQNFAVNTPILYYGVDIVYLLIFLPLSYGIVSSIVKLGKKQNVAYTDFLNDSILNATKAIAIFIRTLLKLVIPGIFSLLASLAIVYLVSTKIPLEQATTSGYAVLIIFLSFISVIILAVFALPYVLANYVLADDNKLSSKEAFYKSKELMKNQQWNFIKLMISMCGWIILLSFSSILVTAFTTENIGNLVQWCGMIFLLPYLDTVISVFFEETQNEIE